MKKKRPKFQEENTSFISEQMLNRFVKELKGCDPLLVVPAASRERAN